MHDVSEAEAPSTFSKSGRTPVAVSRLRREAEMLRRVSHPNVVELISYRHSDDYAELTYAFADGEPFGAGLGPVDTGRLCGDLAATVAFLHDQGIAHMRIEPSHVIVRPNRAGIVLCGFAGAMSEATPEMKARDVVAVGRVLAGVIPSADERLRRRAAGGERENPRWESLSRIAHSVSATAQPSARELAEALRHFASESVKEPAETRRRLPARKLFVLVAGVLSVVALGAIVSAGNSNPSTHRSVPTTGPLSTMPHSDCIDVEAGIDADGDICADSVIIENGLVMIDGERYEVGSAGDLVTVGDWNCTGKATAALVRRSGEVFIFDTWPGPGQVAGPRSVGMIGAQAVSARAVDLAGCDYLSIETTTGTTTIDPRKGA